MDKEFIVSVGDIFLVDKESHYCIPAYQRGYKWTYDEVKTLLLDVDKFIPAGNKFYCLQNITLVRPRERDQYNYNVVDGQQRLTTLMIILAYLFRKENKLIEENKLLDLIKKRLSYDVRAITSNFIREKVCSVEYWEDLRDKRKSSPQKEIEVFFKEEYKRGTEFDYRDIYHIFAASLAVIDFFNRDDKKNKENELRDKFLNHVKIIKNVLWKTDEPKIFAKVNSYRVPLDAADLIRAILITRVPMKHDDAFSLSNLVSLNEKRARIGLELDTINNWWQDSERANYFKRFIPSNFFPDDNGKNLFQFGIYPIDILYILYAIINGRKNLSSLEFYEEKTANATAAWETYYNIIQTQKILQEWYDDSEIYHLIGVLWFFRNGQTSKDNTILIKELYDRWGKGKLREDFISYLKSELRKGFTKTIEHEEDGRKETVPDLNLWLNRIHSDNGSLYNWYEDTEMLRKVLILTDVILHIEDGKSENPKFEKMAVSHFYTYGSGTNSYGGIKEDKEHIFPQTPVSKDEFGKNFLEYWDLLAKIAKNTPDLGKSWRESFNDIVRESNLDKETLRKLHDGWIKIVPDDIPKNESEFVPDLGKAASDQSRIEEIAKDGDIVDALQRLINRFVFKITGVDVNSIGNIVLLSSDKNRSYGNDFFPKKRCKILKMYNSGNFIRLHTRRVFAKEGLKSDNGQQYNEWRQEDIIENSKIIRSRINEFFSNTEMSPEECRYQNYKRAWQ